MLSFWRNGVHPLELVAANQSFQNTESIDSVFTKLLGRSLWTTVLDTEVRLAESPDKTYSFTHEHLGGTKRLFAVRHELVHDPGRRCILSKDVVQDIVFASWLVFGSDVVLMQMLHENRDPALPDFAANGDDRAEPAHAREPAAGSVAGGGSSPPAT